LFRTGGFITGIIGVLMMPWKLVADPSGNIFTWLVGYSALLGPIGGIMIADYFVIRRRHLNLNALHKHDAEHCYTGGFSVVALVALVALFLAILPNLSGFLVTVNLLDRKCPGILRDALQLRVVCRLRDCVQPLHRVASAWI
jgi:NCS1 family nucleobase:cation symporter-1